MADIAQARSPNLISGQVVAVSTGDWVQVQVAGGFFGVDLACTTAPAVDTPQGQAAQARLTELIGGQPVGLEVMHDLGEGRVVALLYREASLVQEWMVQEGQASLTVEPDTTCPANLRFLLQSREQYANQNQLGLWRPGDRPLQAPFVGEPFVQPMVMPVSAPSPPTASASPQATSIALPMIPGVLAIAILAVGLMVGVVAGAILLYLMRSPTSTNTVEVEDPILQQFFDYPERYLVNPQEFEQVLDWLRDQPTIEIEQVRDWFQRSLPALLDVFSESLVFSRYADIATLYHLSMHPDEPDDAALHDTIEHEIDELRRANAP